ncbi:unnamed protein product [Rotaria sp. Silwood2]|nr:unnamed protein product [Rotaria sp. Silwood2]CAF4098483.1 unnamed protein product [Rotaria sp. Silwood2]
MNSLLARDRKGFNCLEVAIRANNYPFVKRLFQCKYTQWKQLMRNAQFSQNNTSVDTPMRKLIRYMPDMAYQALDKCKRDTNFLNEHNKSIRGIQFDFELLEDHCDVKKWQYDTSSNFQKKQKENRKRNCFNHSRELYFVCDGLSRTFDDDVLEAYTDNAHVLVENHILWIIVQQARDSDTTDENIVQLQTKLLRHPTCQELMRRQWYHFGLRIFLTCFFAYLMYLGLFTWVVLRHTNPYHFYNAAGISFPNDDECEKVAQIIKSGQYNITQKPGWGLKTSTDLALKYTIYFLLWLHVAKGILFIIIYRGRPVFRFYIEVVSLILGFVFLYDNPSWQTDVQLRCFVQWQVGAFGLFLAWSTLLVYIRFFPLIGVTVVMLEVVVRRFIWVTPALVILICSFCFSFFMLLQDQAVYGNVGLAWMRTG